jgi:hypothetical protein
MSPIPHFILVQTKVRTATAAVKVITFPVNTACIVSVLPHRDDTPGCMLVVTTSPSTIPIENSVHDVMGALNRLGCSMTPVTTRPGGERVDA